MVADGSPHVKLADFGTAMRIGDPASTRARGTRGYRAPEVCERVREKPYTIQADLYSVGCLIVRLNRKLFADFPPRRLQGRDHAKFRTKVEDFCRKRGDAKHYDSFILQLLQTKPEERGTASALQVHPWILDVET